MRFIQKWVKNYMIRPIIYKTVTKISVGVVLALLWDRFINRNQMLSIVEYAFFCIGVIMMALAWFQYLKLDGLRFLIPRNQKKKKPKKQRDIVDFVDEKIVSFDELEPEEQTVCKLCSDLLGGLALMIPALIAMLF